MMYYIYHIPGVKIGCSTNPKRRVTNQGYTEWEILEKHNDIDIVSQRELELQKQYGYRVDDTIYSQSYDWCNKGMKMAKGKGAKTQIKNKIGIFGFSKEERQKLNKSIALKGGNVTKERYSKPIDMYDYKTGKFIKSYDSIKQASIELNTSNIKSVLVGRRKSTKGYTFKFKENETR